MQQHLSTFASEDELDHQLDSILDSKQAKRREIVRTIVRFAERSQLTVNWFAAIRYILTGDGSAPIISE